MKKYNVIVVFDKDLNKTLMCKRTKEPYKGMFNLVGGKIERENEKQCSKPYKCGNKITKKIQKVLEEIDQNRNHSWAVEMYNRNEKNMSAVALFYRGNKITYKEMFEKAFMYAKSLKVLGYKKDDQIPICITNTPEFIYMLLAISFIGAHTHTVGEWFDKDYLKELIDILGLERRVNHLPNELSGGQQQRVSIGRAIINNPALVLADEPTGNLDSKASDEIVALLKESNKKYNQTLIVITHDENIALQADRIIAIEDGRISRDEVTNK